MVRLVVPASLAVSATGHGYITEPPSRTGAMKEAAGSSPYSAALWFNQGCTIGCPKCLGVDGGFKGCGKDQGTETLPHELKTYNTGSTGCGINPWCAPGSAPIMNPCGVAGGDTKQGAAGNGGDRPYGYNIGDKGTEMRNGVKDFPQRTWVAGSTAEVSWAIIANHGGGYQYRLCPAKSDQTEECFQQTPLEFVGDTQDIQYCRMPEMGPHWENVIPREAIPDETPDPKGEGVFVDPVKYYASLPGCDKEFSRTTFQAMRINTGTIPKGSTWTRNPIPACKSIAGGAFNMGCHVSTVDGKYKPAKSSDFQFPPYGIDKSRADFNGLLGGFGGGACFGCNQEVNPIDCNVFGKIGRNNCSVDETNAQVFSFNIVDKVKVPKVPAGEYVISFRWESEQTPQIWSTCSDITIVASDVAV